MSRSLSLRIWGLLFAGVALNLAYVTQGADRTWSNTAGGVFATGANWSGGVAPTEADAAVFNANASYTVTFGASASNNAVNFYAPGGTVTLDIGSGQEYYIVPSGSMRLQNAGGAAGVEQVSGLLSVNGHVYIGDQATHNGNRLTVKGSGTVLRTRVFDINCGLAGSNNRIDVLDGARLEPYRYLYSGYGAGTNNLVYVSGTGTEVYPRNSGIMVGRNGDYNRLVLENGAQATVTNGIISIGDLAGADGNSVELRSGGGISTSGGNNTCYVGNGGSFNTMTISDGTFSSYYNFTVGGTGSGNRLEVVDGGQVSTRTHVYIGSNAASQSNTVVVAGTGSLLKTTFYDVNVGNYGSYNTLVVSNGATASGWRNVYAGTGAGSSYNTLLVSGAGSTLRGECLNNPSYALAVGLNGTNNVLRLEDGGTFVGNGNYEFAVGVNAGSFSNQVFVGGGCTLTNGGNLYVGKSGGGNTMAVSNAQVNSGYVFIGSGSSGNALAVSGGAEWVARGHFYIGYNTGANSNALFIAGAGTVATNTQFDLDVGRQGAYNRLEITDGAELTIMRHAYIGHYDGAVSNTFLIREGTFRCNQSGAGNVIVSNACTLAIQGSNSVVQARTLAVNTGSGLDVRIGPGGFTPIEVIGRVWFDGTTRLTVDAFELAKAGGGTVTLMNYGSKTGSIAEENMTFVPSGITVNQADGNRITLRIPSFKGTIISVR